MTMPKTCDNVAFQATSTLNVQIFERSTRLITLLMFCVMAVLEQSCLKPGWVIVAHRRVNESLRPKRLAGKYRTRYYEVTGSGYENEIPIPDDTLRLLYGGWNVRCRYRRYVDNGGVTSHTSNSVFWEMPETSSSFLLPDAKLRLIIAVSLNVYVKCSDKRLKSVLCQLIVNSRLVMRMWREKNKALRVTTYRIRSHESLYLFSVPSARLSHSHGAGTEMIAWRFSMIVWRKSRWVILLFFLLLV